MAPKKKKAKATASNARGFATTSQPSKIRAIEPASNDDSAGATASADSGSTNEQTVRSATGNTESGQPSIQQMTPDQLEQHLEDAELQDILDRTGVRCRSESARQVSRLKTERRQLRPQSHRLYTDDWLTDDLIERILTREDPSGAAMNVQSKPNPPSNHEKVLTDLWILHRILKGLGLPNVENAVSHVVHLSTRQHLLQTTHIPFGLNEALDWYAINCLENELPDYEDQVSVRLPKATGEESSEDTQIGKLFPVAPSHS